METILITPSAVSSYRILCTTLGDGELYRTDSAVYRGISSGDRNTILTPKCNYITIEKMRISQVSIEETMPSNQIMVTIMAVPICISEALYSNAFVDMDIHQRIEQECGVHCLLTTVPIRMIKMAISFGNIPKNPFQFPAAVWMIPSKLTSVYYWNDNRNQTIGRVQISLLYANSYSTCSISDESTFQLSLVISIEQNAETTISKKIVGAIDLESKILLEVESSKCSNLASNAALLEILSDALSLFEEWEEALIGSEPDSNNSDSICRMKPNQANWLRCIVHKITKLLTETEKLLKETNCRPSYHHEIVTLLYAVRDRVSKIGTLIKMHGGFTAAKDTIQYQQVECIELHPVHSDKHCDSFYRSLHKSDQHETVDILVTSLLLDDSVRSASSSSFQNDVVNVMAESEVCASRSSSNSIENIFRMLTVPLMITKH